MFFSYQFSNVHIADFVADICGFEARLILGGKPYTRPLKYILVGIGEIV